MIFLTIFNIEHYASFSFTRRRHYLNSIFRATVDSIGNGNGLTSYLYTHDGLETIEYNK